MEFLKVFSRIMDLGIVRFIKLNQFQYQFVSLLLLLYQVINFFGIFFQCCLILIFNNKKIRGVRLIALLILMAHALALFLQ